MNRGLEACLSAVLAPLLAAFLAALGPPSEAFAQGDPFVEAEERLAAGNPQAALEQAERAVSIDPEDSRAHLLKARVLFALGSFDAAAVVYQQAMILAPLDSDLSAQAGEGLSAALLALAGKQAAGGEALEALDTYNRVLITDSENLAALRARASILISLGRPEDARDEFDAALRVDPSDPETLLGAASLAVNAGDDRTAEKHLEALRTGGKSLPPKSMSWALFHLGRIALERGDRGRALSCFQAAVELDPEELDAKNAAEELLSFRRQVENAMRAERLLKVGSVLVVAAWLAALAALYRKTRQPPETPRREL